MGKGLAILGVPVLGGKGDVIAPTCVLSSAAGDPVDVAAAIPVTATFSEDVTSFVIGDITVTNGVASNFVAVSGSVYTFDVTPSALGAVTVQVGAGVCTDAAGNPNEASNTLSRTAAVLVFTQSLGPELLTNGDFSAWTGDNPDGWSVAETAPDPEITQRGTGESHASAPPGIGLANFYRSGTATLWIIQSNKITVGYWYEVGLLVDTVVTSTVRIGGVSMQPPGYTSGAGYTGQIRSIGSGTASSGGAAIVHPTTGAACDITVDNASFKRITLNAQQVMPANAIVDFTYALPASPAAGDTISVFYRISDASLEAGYNCWRAYIQRNSANTAWDFRLDSVNAGTATNRINVTGVGSPTTIRVICDGTKHNCYTLEGTTWTKRGSEVDVSWNDSATGLNTIYCSGTTPNRLTV